MRKALQYFSALSDETSVEWVKAELNAYESGQWKDRKDFPTYRCLRGFLRIRDGWGRLRPLQVPKDVEVAFHCQLNGSSLLDNHQLSVQPNLPSVLQ